jgi:apolipoprotein N-acyltransferase
MKKIHLVLLSLFSGALLSLAWPDRGFPGLLFIGLVPLLWIEDYIARHPEKFIRFSFFFYSYPAFLLWNGLTTWWIYNSTGVGALVAIAANSLFMSIVVGLFHWSRKKLRYDLAAYTALVVFWMAFEYLHLNWDLNWPWLNLGNGFASYYKWVEWYEYTGTFGGTLWVLVSNVLLFFILKKVKESLPNKGKESRARSFILYPISYIWLLWIALPLLISYILYGSYKEERHPVRCVVVQPNIDPYSEQYVLPPQEVVGRILKLSVPRLDSSVNFLVAPESAIQEEMWENDINSFSSIRLLKEINRSYPGLNIIVGGSTFYAYHEGEEITRTARQFRGSNHYYDAYNTAIMVNRTDSLQLYHKSRLTPGVEILPSFRGFKWLEKFAINLGGTVGSLGTDKVRVVYRTNATVPASAVICYESIFGEFFAEFVRNGAQVMFIITNDGWWGNTAGHRQHFSFAHLRAIETRRCIGRSANTGISAFIDQRGDASQVTKYWEPACIKADLNASSKLTFYVRHGDYLARGAVWLTFGLLVMAVVLAFRRRYP